MANRGGRGLRTGVGVRGRTSGTLSDEEREKSADWEVLWDWMGLNPTLLVYTERERERVIVHTIILLHPFILTFVRSWEESTRRGGAKQRTLGNRGGVRAALLWRHVDHAPSTGAGSCSTSRPDRTEPAPLCPPSRGSNFSSPATTPYH